MSKESPLLSVGEILEKERRNHGHWTQQDFKEIVSLAEDLSRKRPHPPEPLLEADHSLKDWWYAETIYTARGFKPAPDFEYLKRERRGAEELERAKAVVRSG
ncbi:MAG: hypothetical protein Q7S03_04420 [bacterium]|nr:hypothetical protein [bacterium]